MLSTSSEKSKGIKRECKSLSGSLENFQLQAQFQHYRSESYANTLCAQGQGGSQSPVCGAEMASPFLLAKTQSKRSKSVPVSAPTSPNRRNIISLKSSTLPHSYGLNGAYQSADLAPSRRSRIANFFKRLSPRLKRSPSKSKDKPWIVVEFSQSEVDGESADASSIGSDHSFELALRTREEQQKISPKRTNSEPVNRITPLHSKLLKKSSLESLEKEVEVSRTHKYIKAKEIHLKKPCHEQMTLSKELQELLDFKLGRSKRNEDSVNGLEFGDGANDNFEEEKLESLPHPIVILSEAQDSFNNSDHVTGSVQLLHSSDYQLKTDIPSLPRLHRIHQPPRTLDILNKIVVRSPKMKKVSVKMASVESIGSCSLDVEATTASESSGTADGRASSVSQHTLHSKGSMDVRDLSNGLAHHSKKVGMIADSSLKEIIFEGPTFISGKHHESNGVCEHKQTTSSDHDAPSRQPSYVNISCSVSGYTSFSCYNSKVREGLHDHSPGVTTLGSLASDLVDVGKLATSHQSKSDKSMYLSVDQFREQKMFQLNSSSAANLRTQFCSDEVIRNSSDSDFNTRVQVNGGVRREPFSKSDYNLEHDHKLEKMCGSQLSSSKSLVQQRIECLYGPNALTQGFLVNRGRPKDSRRRHETDTLQPAVPVNGEVKATSGMVLMSELPIKSYAATGNVNGVSSQDATKEDELTKLASSYTNVVSYSNGHQDDTDNATFTQITEVTCTGKNLPVIKGKDTSIELNQTTDDVERNGYYFIEVMGDERHKIEQLVNQAEVRLADGQFTEEIAGRYRSTIGKANLLLAQKFQQFQGLCDKNINQLPEDPLQTMSSDLEGFWDTIMLQVNDIYDMFEDINLLDDGQKPAVTAAEPDGKLKIKSKTTNGAKPKRLPCKTSTGTAQRSEKAEAAARSREAARKMLVEMKRQARCQKTMQADDVQEVEIFIPSSRDAK